MCWICCCWNTKSSNESDDPSSEEDQASKNALLFETDTCEKTSSVPEKELYNEFPNCENYLVQFDYGDLKKGDLLEKHPDGRNSNKNFVYVRHPVTGIITKAQLGFLAPVINFVDEPWAFPEITRNEAEVLLNNADEDNGIFLVRPRSDEKIPYVLSVKETNGDQFKISHYQIHKKNNFYGKEGQEDFVTVGMMIQYFIDNGFITKPCPKNINIELNLKDITFSDELLGEGNFGKVWRAKWQSQDVAVKELRPSDDNTTELEREIQIINQYRHPRIVKMFGVCKKEESMLMVYELMSRGNLHKYIQETKLNLEENIRILQQVCEGMMYLENYKVLHRDLAARNILLGDNLTAKIGDFGLSRKLDCGIYLCTSSTKLPIRWLAIETLLDSVFLCKSDVWMYGILAMEVFTGGQLPYVELKSNSDVISRLCGGYRMKQPDQMPEDIYQIIHSCWNKNPDVRPTFSTLYNFFHFYNSSSN